MHRKPLFKYLFAFLIIAATFLFFSFKDKEGVFYAQQVRTYNSVEQAKKDIDEMVSYGYGIYALESFKDSLIIVYRK